MRAFLQHGVFEFKTRIRSRPALLMNYLLPLGFYLIIGSIIPQINPPFRDTMMPAMVIFAILAATFLGLPDPLVNAREAGIFRSYKINGVPSSFIIAIPAMTTGVHLVIVATLITVTASWLFEAGVPVDWVAYMLIFAVTAFTCAGMSSLIGVVSPSTQMTVLWSQLVFLPSMLLGGIMLPYSLLPETVAKISKLLPTTHAMNAFNGLAMGGVADFSPWGSMAVLFLSGGVAFGLAIYLFRWDRHHTAPRRHPLMAFLVLLPYVVSVFWF